MIEMPTLNSDELVHIEVKTNGKTRGSTGLYGGSTICPIYIDGINQYYDAYHTI
jgi:hypothetical protein